MIFRFLLLIGIVVLNACAGIEMRKEGGLRSSMMKDKRSRADLVTENANLKAQITDYEEQFRSLSGKVEELEVAKKKLEEGQQKMLGEESKEIIAYKESISELLAEKKKLEAKVAVLEVEKKDAVKAIANAKRSAADHLKKGDELFDDKKWTEAVSEYQSYREKAKNKKNEDYALTTYKIGVCFQELGMVREAKTFYQSVVKKHKGLKAAKYASYRLSQLTH